MRKLAQLAVAGAIMAGATGCYHATIDTGRAPSGQVVEKDWAHGFVYGLVPPSTVETAAKCPNGVAKVETQLSFLNQLASFLTGGIYTPMEITVQCAAAGTAMSADVEGKAELVTLPSRASKADLAEALDAAAEKASATHKPVFVQFMAVE